jgi:outer membrane protein TolC
LTQPLLKNFWIDSTRYQISLGKTTLKIDQLALRLQIMTVVNNMKAAYYTLISDRELVGVQEIAVKLAEETMARRRAKECRPAPWRPWMKSRLNHRRPTPVRTF